MATKVTTPGGVEWTVRRLLVVNRPLSLRAASESEGYALPALVLDAVAFTFTLPLLPLRVWLRRRGTLAWTLEATCRPWGRRGPKQVMRWRVKGNTASKDAVGAIADAFARGDGAPSVTGAERTQ
jgi:hypothetical protein